MFQKQSQLLGQTFSGSPSACLARRRFQSAGSQAGASGSQAGASGSHAPGPLLQLLQTAPGGL